MSTEQEKRDNILKPYIRLEPGRHSPVNVDLANSFWEKTTNKFLAVLGLMDTKVRMEDGKGLSDQNFTLEEKEKLAGLESSHYRGTYDSLNSLQSNVLNPVAGDYADVDGGQGHITSRYLWDPTDNHWEQMIGESTQLTGSQIKVMYESQPDTNVFDDNAKNKLTGISSGATKNQTDSYLLDRTNHTGTQPVSTITGLGTAATRDVGTAAGNLLEVNSNYFGVQSHSDFPNGTLIRTSFPAAEFGPSITLKIWGKGYGGLPHLIIVEAYQYNGGWYSTSGISLSGNITNVTVMELDGYVCFWFASTGYWNSFFAEAYDTEYQSSNGSRVTSIENSTKPSGTKVVDIPLAITHNTGNILATTGQSTEYPMSQKATTDALNTKANTSTQVISGTGLSGGGNLSENRTLSVNYGTAAGTAAQGNDSRIVNALRRDVANASGFLALGNTQSIAGVDRSIEIATNTEFGGSYDNHTGVRLVSNMPDGWGSGRFGVQIATGWGVYGPTKEVLHTGNILTTTGQSTSYPMTQKATTDAINAAVANASASGPRPVKDHGAVATAGSQTVVCNVQESDFHMLDMSGANATGALTIDFANIPELAGKHFGWHVRLRRGGVKNVLFSQNIRWSGNGSKPAFGTGTNSHDLLFFYKVGDEEIRGMTIDAW